MTQHIIDAPRQNMSGMMIAFLSFALPLLIFIILFLTPSGSIAFYSPMAHSLLLLATCLIAFYTALTAYHTYLESKNVRLLVITSSFTIFGIGFLIHALALPFLSLFNEIVFDLTEHSGLLFGSIVFFGLFLPIYDSVDAVYKKKTAILSYIVAFTLAWFLAIIFLPLFADFVEGIIPVIIIATALFFLITSLILVKKYDDTAAILTRYLIIGFSILINAAIIPLFYTEWTISWWYFHFVFLAGFIAILLGLIKSRRSEEGLEAVFYTEDTRSRISTKIVVMVVALMVLVAIILSSATSRYVTASIQKSVGDIQLKTAQETIRNIDRMLYERYMDIQDLATSVVIEKYLAGTATRAELQYRIDGFKSTTGPWDSIDLFDTSGKPIISSGSESRVGSSAMKGVEKDIFAQALSGHAAYSDLVISDVTGKPTIYFATPVNSQRIKGSPVVAVAIGQFTWSIIESELTTIVAQGVHLHIFNKAELIIATNGDRADLFNQDARRISQSGLSQNIPVSLMQKSNEGTFIALISQAPERGYKAYRGNGWHVLIESPASIVFADVSYVVEKIITVLVALIAIVSLILLVVLYRLVFVPARKLSEALSYIAEHGDLVRVPVESNDEMGTLAKAFNKMVETLSRMQVENMRKSDCRDDSGS